MLRGPSARLARRSDAADSESETIVVLGCRAVVGAEGRLAPGALARRLQAAATAYAERASAQPLVVVSGGRRWENVVEADIMALELGLQGVPESALVRERCSLSTRDNARFVAEALVRRGFDRATIVTCAWHMPRAMALFSRAGIDARGFAAAEGAPPSARQRFWRWGREAVLSWTDGVRGARGHGTESWSMRRS